MMNCIFLEETINMRTKNQKIFIGLFCILLVFELVTGSYESLANWHYIAKPSLVLALIVFYWLKSQEIKPRIRILTLLALLFSVIGDCLLMFVDQSPHFFTFGLVSFLLAHIIYSMVFLKSRNQDKKPWLFVGFLAIYAAGLIYLLHDNLGAMLLPILLYMFVILTMATSAFLRQGSVSKISFSLVFIGAILFLISDSLLAINKFYAPLPLSHISIMFTYAFAQLFIVFGLLKQQ